MRAGTAARVVVVLLLAVAPLTPLAVTDIFDGSAERPQPGESAAVEERLRRGPLETGSTDGNQREALVVVELKEGTKPPTQPALDIQQVYTRRGTRHLQGYAALSDVRQLSNDPDVTTVRIKSLDTPVGPATRVAPGVATVGADDLHRRGLDGAGVTVGIIDAGFRVSNPEIAANVGAYRSFDAGDADRAHGTAVASVVADTAPDATLHLAAVGSTTTPEEYERAVEWLEASGADVVVDAGSYFGQAGDGTGPLAQVAADASEDALFVTSAGNYARRHWADTHDATADGRWVDFAPGTEANALGGGEPIRGRVTASLRWNDANATATNATTANATTGNATNASGDYDIYLFRRQFRDDRLVATSADGTGDARTAYLDVTVPRGQYYLAVRAGNTTGTHDLSLFVNRELARRNASGSLTAPATAPGVLTVGAHDGSGVAPFSSRGPVDNRSGVDLVAPDSVAVGAVEDGEGTSYAAPYVAGTAALLAAEHPDLTAADLRTVLRESARDVDPTGVDPASGHGLLDAQRAADLAHDRTTETERADGPSVDVRPT